MRSLSPLEELSRPLGIGYEDYPSFLRRYIYPANSPVRTPDLGISLAALHRAGVFGVVDSKLTSNPCCLIQGITSPRNGACLREFLEIRGIAQPDIHAIDIANVAALLETMDIPFPDVRFSVADATSLPGFATGSVQILVQDHLLNCTPHGTHEAIIREAARLLAPHGFLILNFSVNSGNAAGKLRTRAEIEEIFGIPLSDTAYCLGDLFGASSKGRVHKTALMGEIVTLGNTGRSIVITRPEGNFEFYFSKAELEERLLRYGLQFTFATSEDGIDENGIPCVRYRTIVRHCE